MPALARLEGVFRGFSNRHAVVMAVQDDMLTLTWMADGERQWRRVAMPADCCRDGLPMQRESLGEYCADLLLDSGLPSASVDLELLLPLEACHWRLLAGDGASSCTSLADVRSQQPLLEWPFQLDDAYLAAMAVPGGADAQVVVGVQHLLRHHLLVFRFHHLLFCIIYLHYQIDQCVLSQLQYLLIQKLPLFLI